MFAKIVKGKDLTELESEVNQFLTDHKFDPVEKAGIMADYSGYPEQVGGSEVARTAKKSLKVYNVQQFVIGRSDTSTVSLIDPKLQITYYFCLLLICGYE